MFDYNFNTKLEDYYFNIFQEIHEEINDYETLQMGIEILKIAMQRLDSDLDNEKIKKEYMKLGYIIRELEEIEKNYV